MIKVKLSEKYPYGQKMFLKTSMPGKPKEAFILSRDIDHDILIKMSEVFPYTPGKDPHFFVHIEKLQKWWRHAKEGMQTKIF